jgi:3-hydroxybutyryl-CoA dehydrogenase
MLNVSRRIMSAREIQRITVIGAGVMGHSIAQDFACAGFNVALHDIDELHLVQAKHQIQANLSMLVERGFTHQDKVASTMKNLKMTTCLAEAVEQADFILEAIYENLDLKKRVFAELDQLASSHTILGSNTSSYMPSMLAEATRRPDRVLGVHYFYPPHLIPLVEIVRGRDTSDQTLDAVITAVKTAGKEPIRVQKEVPGFIANRMQTALLREALSIISQGIASAQDVDKAVKLSFGRRLAIKGPIEMSEVQDGWEIMYEIMRVILPSIDSSIEPPHILNECIAKQELGPRTGKGFYIWSEEQLGTWEHELQTGLMQINSMVGGSKMES